MQNLLRKLLGRSLKGQLLWTIFAMMSAIMVVSGCITYALFGNHLKQQQDDALEGKARLIRAVSSQDGKYIGFQFDKDAWTHFRRPDNPELYHLRFADTGKDFFLSPSLDDNSLPRPKLQPERNGDPVFDSITLPDGKPGRMVSVQFQPPVVKGDEPPSNLYLSVAMSRQSVNDALSSLRDFLIRGGIVSTGLLLIISYLLVTRNLRPLDALAKQIDKIPVTDSPERFQLENAPDELDPVIDRLNDLMFRFEKVVENERAFTTNAAHELRNPLAGMRSQLEVALSRDRTPEEYERVLRQVLEIEMRLQSSVENLLLLSRLQSTEPGAAAREFQLSNFDFGPLLRRSWKPHFDKAEDKELKLKWQVARDLPSIRTSERLVELVVRNLFDNAVSYTTTGGTLRIEANWKRDVLIFAVENTNPGLTQADLDQMLSRFWRADPARHGEHLHAGIGLGLCSRIAEVLEGSIVPSLTSDGFLRMEFTFPPDCTPPPDTGHPTTRLY
ncbi:MAG: two-component system heavy metal sensor histidine kinase CusS [Verrucomicrobiales bacterium]